MLADLAIGIEDPDRVTAAFLVATAALQQEKTVLIWALKDAVRLGLSGEAQDIACEGVRRSSGSSSSSTSGAASSGSARSA